MDNNFIKTYHNILNGHFNNIDELITKIVSDPNYDPNQWVIQYHRLKKENCWAEYLFKIMIRCLRPKHYEVFPIEWWMLAYQYWPTELKQLIDETQNEFLQRIMLLIELRG